MADEEVSAPMYQQLRHTLFYSALFVWAAVTGAIAITAKKDEVFKDCASKCCKSHYEVMFPAGVAFLILMGLYGIISILRCWNHNKYEWTGTWETKNYFFHYVEPITMFLSLCVVIAVDVTIFFFPCKDHQPNVPQAVVATFSVFFLAIFVWFGGCFVYAGWKDKHEGEPGYDVRLEAVPFFPRTSGMNYFRI